MGERGAVGQPLHPYRAVAVDDHWAAVRSIPTAIALATPITDFQRQHRRNVETGCRGGTEGGEVTAEECCIAPHLTWDPALTPTIWSQGGLGWLLQDVATDFGVT
jgi:hypothetical protein